METCGLWSKSEELSEEQYVRCMRTPSLFGNELFLWSFSVLDLKLLLLCCWNVLFFGIILKHRRAFHIRSLLSHLIMRLFLLPKVERQEIVPSPFSWLEFFFLLPQEKQWCNPYFSIFTIKALLNWIQWLTLQLHTRNHHQNLYSLPPHLVSFKPFLSLCTRCLQNLSF